LVNPIKSGQKKGESQEKRKKKLSPKEKCLKLKGRGSDHLKETNRQERRAHVSGKKRALRVHQN